MGEIAHIKGTDMSNITETTGEKLDKAGAAILLASKRLAEIDLKKTAIEAQGLGANRDDLEEVCELVTEVRRCLAMAECVLTAAHLKAIDITKAVDNQLSTRSGR